MKGEVCMDLGERRGQVGEWSKSIVVAIHTERA